MDNNQRWAALTAGRILVIDTETTGKYPDTGDRVVSLAMVCVDNGAVTHPWYSLVNPGRAMDATFVHGLTDADVAAAPSFAQIAPIVAATFQGAVAIAGHNVDFDVRFLRMEMERAGSALPEVPTLDTRALSRRFAVECASERLPDVAAGFGAVADGDWHNALADAQLTAELLRRQLWRGVLEQGWTDLAQVAAETAPTGPPRGSGGRRSDSLSINILDLMSDEDWQERREEWQAERAAREAARTADQAEVWARFQAATDYRATPAQSMLRVGADVFAAALAVYPPGHVDLVEIGEKWGNELAYKLDGARVARSKAKNAGALLDCYDQLWPAWQAGGLCRHHADTYYWPEACAATGEKGRAFYRRWAPVLAAWPSGVDCRDCSRPFRDAGARVCGTLEYDGEPTVDPAAIAARDAEWVAWMRAFADAGDMDGVAAAGAARLRAFELVEDYAAAVAAVDECFAAGGRSYHLANRAGIIHERKLGDPAAALKVSQHALAWTGMASESSFEAVAKRASRLSKKLGAGVPDSSG